TFAPRTPLHALARRFAGALRSRGSLALLVRFLSHPTTFAPRTPPNLAEAPAARSVRVAHSRCSFAFCLIRRRSPLGLPPTSPNRLPRAPSARLTRAPRSLSFSPDDVRPSDCPPPPRSPRRPA